MSKKNDRAKLSIILPEGTAIYPKLNKPDTKFDAEGVYESKQRLDYDAEGGMIGRKGATLEEILDAMAKLRDQFVEEKRAELASKPDPKSKKKAREITVRDIGEPDLDDDGNETGKLILKAKMKASGTAKDGSRYTRQPKLFDAKNKPLDIKKTQIWGGSTLKIACTAVPYYAANDNVVGVTLYLEAVQVIDLVSGGGRDASAFGFGETDGYVGEEQSDDAPFGDPDDDGAAGSTPDDF